MNKKEMKKRIFKSVVENHSDIEQEDLEKFYAKWIKEYPENLILDVMGEYFFLDPLSYPSSDDEMGYTTIYSDLEDYELELELEIRWVDINEAIANNIEIMESYKETPFWALREVKALQYIKDNIIIDRGGEDN